MSSQMLQAEAHHPGRKRRRCRVSSRTLASVFQSYITAHRPSFAPAGASSVLKTVVTHFENRNGTARLFGSPTPMTISVLTVALDRAVESTMLITATVPLRGPRISTESRRRVAASLSCARAAAPAFGTRLEGSNRRDSIRRCSWKAVTAVTLVEALIRRLKLRLAKSKSRSTRRLRRREANSPTESSVRKLRRVLKGALRFSAKQPSAQRVSRQDTDTVEAAQRIQSTPVVEFSVSVRIAHC